MSRTLQDSGKYHVLSNVPIEELEHMKVCAAHSGIVYEVEDEAHDIFDRRMPGFVALLAPPWDVKQGDEIELFFDVSHPIRKRLKEHLLEKGYSKEFLDSHNIYLGCEKHWSQKSK